MCEGGEGGVGEGGVIYIFQSGYEIQIHLGTAIRIYLARLAHLDH